MRWLTEHFECPPHVKFRHRKTRLAREARSQYRIPNHYNSVSHKMKGIMHTATYSKSPVDDIEIRCTIAKNKGSITATIATKLRIKEKIPPWT